MNKTTLILVVVSLIVNVGYSQTERSNKRPAFDLKLFVNDDQFFQASMPETSYVINDSIIQIFPGEKLFIEVAEVNGKLSNFRVVNQINDKDKTIVVDFQQVTKGKVHEQMILIIDNPFDKQIYYKAKMNLMKNNRWVNTSVYPVMPRLKSIEMWPDFITSLALVGFELKDN